MDCLVTVWKELIGFIELGDVRKERAWTKKGSHGAKAKTPSVRYFKVWGLGLRVKKYI